MKLFDYLKREISEYKQIRQFKKFGHVKNEELKQLSEKNQAKLDEILAKKDENIKAMKVLGNTKYVYEKCAEITLLAFELKVETADLRREEEKLAFDVTDIEQFKYLIDEAMESLRRTKNCLEGIDEMNED